MPQQANDWSKYEAMQKAGMSPHDIYRAGKADDLDPIALICMLRCIFGFDLMRAKEVTIQADGLAGSLDEYQVKLAPAIEQALDEIEREA